MDQKTAIASPLISDGFLTTHQAYNAARKAVMTLGLMDDASPRDVLMDWYSEADEAGIVFVDPKTNKPVCIDLTILEESEHADDRGAKSDETVLRSMQRVVGRNAPQYMALPRERVSQERMALIFMIAQARVATLALDLGMDAPVAAANDNHDPCCPTCGQVRRG